jgi:hypothetical protein
MVFDPRWASSCGLGSYHEWRLVRRLAASWTSELPVKDIHLAADVPLFDGFLDDKGFSVIKAFLVVDGFLSWLVSGSLREVPKDISSIRGSDPSLAIL